MRVVVLATVLVVAARARGQTAECTEGRARVDGYCCWPGQAFSSITRRCEGVPRCPSGLAEHGAACIALSPPALVDESTGVTIPEGYAAAPAAAVAPSEMAPVLATSTEGWPAEHLEGELRRARRQVGRDEELVVMALVLYDVGWSMAWVGTILDVAIGGCSRHDCGAWPFALIPLAGGTVSTLSTGALAGASSISRDNYSGLPLGAIGSMLQGVGLIAAAIAFGNRTGEVTFTPLVRGSDFTFSLRASAPGALAGLSLEGTY